jgi:hypothetical protein
MGNNGSTNNGIVLFHIIMLPGRIGAVGIIKLYSGWASQARYGI